MNARDISPFRQRFKTLQKVNNERNPTREQGITNVRRRSERANVTHDILREFSLTWVAETAKCIKQANVSNVGSKTRVAWRGRVQSARRREKDGRWREGERNKRVSECETRTAVRGAQLYLCCLSLLSALCAVE